MLCGNCKSGKYTKSNPGKYIQQMNMVTVGPSSLAGSTPAGMEKEFISLRKNMRNQNYINQGKRSSKTKDKRAQLINKMSMQRADKDGGVMVFKRTQPMTTSKMLAMQNIPNSISFALSSMVMTPLMFSCLLPAPVTTYITSLMVLNVFHQAFSVSPIGKRSLKTSTVFDNKSLLQQYTEFKSNVALKITTVPSTFQSHVVYTPTRIGIFKNWYPSSQKLNLVRFDPHFRALYYRYLSYMIFGFAIGGSVYHLYEDE